MSKDSKEPGRKSRFMDPTHFFVNKIAREVNEHGHTPSCGKYKSKCRYGFPKPPSDKTIIAEPLPKDMNEKERESKLKKYRKIMKKVKDALESPDLNENADLLTHGTKLA